MRYYTLIGIALIVVSLFPLAASAASISQPTVTTRSDGLSAVVAWTTSENGSSKVIYGTSGALDTTSPEYPTNTTRHEMLILNLIPEETYTFVAISQTNNGEALQSGPVSLTMPKFNGQSPTGFIETTTGAPSFLAPWKQNVRNMSPGMSRSAMLLFLTILDQLSLLRVATLLGALGVIAYADARRKQSNFQVVDAVTHEPITTSIMSILNTSEQTVRQVGATDHGAIHMPWPMREPVKVVIQADGYQTRQIIFERDLYTISMSKAGGGARVIIENWAWRLSHSLKYQHYALWIVGVIMVLLSISQSFDLVSQSLIILYIGLGILVLKTHPNTYQFVQLVDASGRPIASLAVSVIYERHSEAQISDNNGYIKLYYPLPRSIRVAKTGNSGQEITVDATAIQGSVTTSLNVSLGETHVSDTPAM
jgi:hypothetical protein